MVDPRTIYNVQARTVKIQKRKGMRTKPTNKKKQKP